MTRNPDVRPVRAPSAGDLLWGVVSALSGLGIVFLTFLGAVPGLLAAVLLAVVATVVLVIPIVAAGAVIGLIAVSMRVVRRAFRSRPALPRHLGGHRRHERGSKPQASPAAPCWDT